jgi:hypothetical protein
LINSQSLFLHLQKERDKRKARLRDKDRQPPSPLIGGAPVLNRPFLSKAQEMLTYPQTLYAPSWRPFFGSILLDTEIRRARNAPSRKQLSAWRQLSHRRLDQGRVRLSGDTKPRFKLSNHVQLSPCSCRVSTITSTEAKQFKLELEKQAIHIRTKHNSALLRLTRQVDVQSGEVGVQKIIEKDFGAWLGWYTVTHIFKDPQPISLRTMLYVVGTRMFRLL